MAQNLTPCEVMLGLELSGSYKLFSTYVVVHFCQRIRSHNKRQTKNDKDIKINIATLPSIIDVEYSRTP